jgi:phosphoribosylformylglycinamidine (FGAM) synthase-like enzyme
LALEKQEINLAQVTERQLNSIQEKFDNAVNSINAVSALFAASDEVSRKEFSTFASIELTEETESKRSNVQVGDPFTEKLLLEASLEVCKKSWLVGIQDMGAAGITCSSSEMSAKGECGIKIDLDKVPLREEGMNAYEIMLSESQERMLIVTEKGFGDELNVIFEKWDLNCTEVGVVTDTGKLEVWSKGKVVAEIPSVELVLGGGAPVCWYLGVRVRSRRSRVSKSTSVAWSHGAGLPGVHFSGRGIR